MPRYIDVDQLTNWINTNAVTGLNIPGPTAPPSAVTSGKSLVFSAPFTSTADWTYGKTSAYPGQTNPSDNKLDWLNPAPTLAAGRFMAIARITDNLWITDLATTEGSANGFQAKAGDELSATVTVYNQQGAWPAIWTWKDGRNEVDCFEYHADNPTLLELTNHTNTAGTYFSYASPPITPGTPFQLVTKFKTAGVEWWINGIKVFTGTGVPTAWSAYLIVNMSVSAGKFHPGPAAGTSQLYFDVAGLRVWR